MNHRLRGLLLLSAAISLGANYRSANFAVEAPTAAIAQDLGQTAERLRKDLAVTWLGKEMPAWAEPCPLEVKVTAGRPGGVSTINFDDGGRVARQRLQVEGPLERIRNGVLPHELTHVLFAHHFGRQPPRWADEGGAILGEDKTVWAKHDQNLWQVLDTPGRRLPLQRLFGNTDYDADIKVFYGEAASITRFLVNQSDRPKFLAFVSQGMRDGWEEAVKKHYNYRNLDGLEAAWIRQQHADSRANQPAEAILIRAPRGQR
jgi:hypothetical protein